MDGRVGYTTASLPSRVGGWTATRAFFLYLELQGEGKWVGSIYVEREGNVFLVYWHSIEMSALRWRRMLYVDDAGAEMACLS